MKRLLPLVFALTLLESACDDVPPTSAPPPPGEHRDLPNAGVNPNFRAKLTQAIIDAARSEGKLDDDGAQRANAELEGVLHWIARVQEYSGGALTPEQRQQANDRLDEIERHVKWMGRSRY